MANQTIYPYGTNGSLPSSIGIVNDFITGGADKALSAEAGKELYADLYGAGKTAEDATVYATYRGVESTTPNRLRVVLAVGQGATISASCSLGQGVAASIYDTVEKCKKADTDYLQTISYTYVPSLTGVAEYNGYLCVSLAKVGDGTFSDSDIEDYVDALDLHVSIPHNGDGDIIDIQGRLAKLENSSEKSEETKNKLFLGTLVQKSMTATGLSDTNKDYRVSMASNCVIPRERATLKFFLPDGFAVGIRNGNQAENLSNNNYWFFNGDTFTFLDGVHYFRLCFAKGIYLNPDAGLNETITLSEVVELISNGDIAIYIDGEIDIKERNRETEKYVKAAMRNYVTGIANNGSLTKLPVFAHTSDMHGDATRFKSFMDYCDFLGVDAALVSGDTVAYNPVDSMQYINDIADEHTTPALLCMGNHDARNLMTAQAQYDTILGYLITKNAVTTNPNESYPTYYYKDFSSKSIRVISVNLYELSHSGDNANFTQTQCQWLISTLASTPQGYGVIIMFHSPESRPNKDNNYTAFYQDLLTWYGYQAGLSGDVFRQIVDAFIGKTSTTITYTSGSSISVSADFTNVASGVEFIAYVNGHLHADLVGYIDGATHKQLNLNVCCGVAIYGSTYQGLANLSDLPRGCSGSTQDSFNIYAIDRGAGVVRIARVGSNISGYDLSERKYIAIPYK